MNKKVKKIISFNLICTTLILNFFGNISYSNDRYEILSGNNIEINEILEESNINVSIEGNTMISPLKNTAFSSGSLEIFKKIDNGKIINDSNTGVSSNNNYYMLDSVKKELLTLKRKTSYTIFISGNITFGDNNSNRCVVPFYRKKVDNVVTTVAIKDINLSQNTYFNEKINFTTIDEDIASFGFYISGANDLVKNVNVYYHIIEGDWKGNERPDYFEGLKSVGEIEENKIEITSKNINLFEGEFELGGTTYGSNLGMLYEDMKVVSSDRVRLKDLIAVESGRTYVLKIFDIKNLNFGFQFYDKDKRGLNIEPARTSTFMKYKVPDNAEYINIFIGTIDGAAVNESDLSKLKCMLAISENEPASYIEPKINKKQIILNEPLRGLPSGVKDRLIQINNIWYIERNCYQLNFDEYEQIKLSVGGETTETVLNGYVSWDSLESRGFPKGKDDIISSTTSTNILATVLPVIRKTYLYTQEGVGADRNGFNISVFRKNLSLDAGNNDTSILFDYLKKKNFSIIYQLDTPIYEEIKEFTVPIYSDVTCIFNNSTIPAKMQVIVDRTANLAQKYIELAKEEPTLYNISQARYWTNLLRESILKDNFHNKVNNIISISDLTLEKKNLSVNSDIYIKMKNTLSLSLDTNSIVFEDFNNTESIEKQEAVKLTVTSSLPYKVNAYLETPISNADNSKSLDTSILNIKPSTNSTYQGFRDIKTPLVLLDDQDAGVDTIHNIDLRLASNGASKTDVYKTTIKFEIEQK